MTGAQKGSPAGSASTESAPKPVWWHLYGDNNRNDSPEGELSRRDPTKSEATGQWVLNRAAFTAGVGGAIIALFSFAFGPRFFVSDVRLLGIISGLVIIALAMVAPVGTQSRKTAVGALIIVAAIVAFPIAAGGYFIGSVVSIIGGALLVAYEPPTGAVEVTVRAASRVRRFVALAFDFVAAAALHRLLYRVAPGFFSGTLNVVVAWTFCWVAVAIVPTMWFRRTPGRILVALRLVDTHTAERAEPVSVLAREMLRGVIALGGFFVIMRVILGDDLRIVAGLIAMALIGAIGFALERFAVMDTLTGAVSVYDSIDQEN